MRRGPSKPPTTRLPRRGSVGWLMWRKGGGVLAPLNGCHRDPFAHRPDMIGQARRHRRCLLPPVPLVVAFVERAHRPAEVITVHGKEGHRLVNPPVLAERVGLANLPGVVV